MRNNSNITTVVWLVLLSFVLTMLVPSCNIDGDLEECPYNARLEYWYTAGGTTNRLPDYISRIKGYVYDSEGVLCAINDKNGKDVLYGELNILPGKYTIVSWGNLDTTSHVWPDAEIGKSRLEDMQLYLDDPYDMSEFRSTDGFHHISEKLYYNYLEIEVSGRGVTRQRAYMTHAHCLLNLTVVWKYSPPEDTGNFSFRLSDVPFRYGFPLSGYLRETSWVASDGQHLYPLPEFFADRGSVCAAGKMNIVRTLSASLCCYRLANDDHPLLNIYQGNEPIVEGLDLWKFFNTMHIDLNNNLRQEFDLRIEIDGTDVYISTFSAGDWEDGGTVDGVM